MCISPLMWSKIGAYGIDQERSAVTRPVQHRGRYYNRTLRVDDSVFALCPPRVDLKYDQFVISLFFSTFICMFDIFEIFVYRPSYIFLIELFQLADEFNLFDRCDVRSSYDVQYLIVLLVWFHTCMHSIESLGGPPYRSATKGSE